ncbi:hypothetical protein ApDm4_1168 [Acetobacter pomorum]|nr:hypothetical protein ApDm4_1168 [Acetobacter pomorum]
MSNPESLLFCIPISTANQNAGTGAWRPQVCLLSFLGGGGHRHGSFMPERTREQK